jgi:hypothetical protein
MIRTCRLVGEKNHYYAGRLMDNKKFKTKECIAKTYKFRQVQGGLLGRKVLSAQIWRIKRRQESCSGVTEDRRDAI